MRPLRVSLALVSLLGALVALNACQLQRCSEGAACNISKVSGPSSIPTPSPAVPAPSPSPSATPADPCKPVVGVNLSGPTSVPIGEVFKVDVTPVSPAGPLEGSLDYCNSGRFVTVDAISSNLRCVGSCSGFGPQFLAQGVGPFSVTIRVEGASATFAGTVSR
jgi:hypothetical protein